MAKIIDFWSLLQRTQEYISKNYAAALIEHDKSQHLKNYIDKYLRDYDYKVEGMETKAVLITMMDLSKTVFLRRAAVAPATTPITAAIAAAITPSLAEVRIPSMMISITVRPRCFRDGPKLNSVTISFR